MVVIFVVDCVLGIDIEVSNVELCISVSDQGCGISLEICDKFFIVFFIIKLEGMGVGLLICCFIIEFYCGCLWVEDNIYLMIGSGMIFIFILLLEVV